MYQGFAAILMICVSFLTAPVQAHAADFKSQSHKMVLLAEVLSCGASAMDGVSTAAAIDAGGREANVLFAGHGKGNISYAKLIGYKSALCGAPILASLLIHRRASSDYQADMALLPGLLSTTGVFSWATIHNYGVVSDLRYQRAQAALHLAVP
ncbi:MAG TPA: hypothetical protein VG273_11810 [Bryobacteraceae bacterium]|jgi:hypothetical protein|nr:hypothetical protein [Bryobacteraceae bacterium]